MMWLRSAVLLFTIPVSLNLVLSEGAEAAEAAEVVDTVAGTGSPANNGDSGLGLQVNVGDPFGVEVGPDGALYITEVRNHRVLRIDLENGSIRTVAGSGRKGYSGDGGPATKAELNEPYEVRFDKTGDMYFVEMQNHLIRKVARSTGIITTIAGTGQMGFGGDGGAALKAKFNRPHSIALDHRGHLYVADIGNHRIRQIDLRQGTVRTIAGNGDRTLPQDGQPAAGTPVLGPRALFVSGDTMWIALREGHSVWRLNLEQFVWNHVAGSGEQGYSGDGGQAKTATFNGPKGLAISPTGDILVVDTENHAIRRIKPDGWTIETVAGGGRGSSGDGGPATEALMDRPHGICVASDGTIFVGDTLNHRVRRVSNP